MSTNIKTWYDFILQQMAAESYWDQSDKFGGNRTAADVLMFGSNNPNQYIGLDPAILTTLPGATRMTETQATDFTTRYTIVSHLPDTVENWGLPLNLQMTTGSWKRSIPA